MTDPKTMIDLIERKLSSIEKLIAEVRITFRDLARLATEQAEELNYFEQELEEREKEDEEE